MKKLLRRPIHNAIKTAYEDAKVFVVEGQYDADCWEVGQIMLGLAAVR